MKTTTTAALLLMSAIVFLPQASLAGDKAKPPKLDPIDCPFKARATACTDKLEDAHDILGMFSGNFVSKNADKDFFGLRCKVAFSEIKMKQDKPADAELKLYDSVVKIRTLYNQGKIDDYQASEDMAEAMEEARACAEAQIPTTP